MCGIAGWTDGGHTRRTEQVLSALRHRGPDATGVDEIHNQDWSHTLVHTRLSINDLSQAGDQPLWNEDRSIALVFNGEIYNSPELRRYCERAGHRFSSRSDGEVIVHLWEMHGADTLRRLNGIFALALVDRRTGELLLARDPLGVKPLFYVVSRDNVWFASELRALAATDAPLGSLDVTALAQFLAFLWIPDPLTPFHGARTLEPGSYLRWTKRGIQIENFVDLIDEAGEAPAPSFGAAQREIRERVTTAVTRQTLSDVPLGLMASGGIDSSVIWWAADSSIARAFTIDWGDATGPERLEEDPETVGILARHFGDPVEYVNGEDVAVAALPPSGDLFADPAFDLCRLIARRAHDQGFKVLFSGQGGDEMFGGYRRHVLGPLAARMPFKRLGRVLADNLERVETEKTWWEYTARFARAASMNDPLSSYLHLCTYSTANDRARALDCSEAEVSDEIVSQRHRATYERLPTSWSLLRRFRALDLLVYLPGLGLAYTDRAGMEHGVEIRVPWLDLELVRWALRLPNEALIAGHRGKRLTRRLAGGVLPKVVSTRPKRGFAAPARLVRTEGPSGARGFRQGAYFASATRILNRWLERPLAER